MASRTWFGGFSSDWFSPFNWNELSVPDSDDDVAINHLAGGAVDPVITGGTASANSVAVVNGDDLTVGSGGILSVQAGIDIESLDSNRLIVNSGGVIEAASLSIGGISPGALGNGTLIIGGAGAAIAWGGGSISPATIALNASNSQIIFNTTDNVLFSNSIVGDQQQFHTTGNLVQKGAGTTVTLTGANSYGGTTTVGAGATLQIGNGGTTGSLGFGGVTDNGALIFDLTSLTFINNVISGSGSVTFEGGAEFELLSGSSYTGGTTVSSGTRLDLGNGTTNGAVTGAIVDNGIVAFDNTGVTVTSGVISGSGLVDVFGAGLTLTGANTYTGTTFIGSGTVTLGNNGTTGFIASGAVIDNGALAFAHTDILTIANAISGTGAVNQTGSGQTILSGANTYSGTTTISAGTLTIGNNGATGTLGTGAVVDNASLSFGRTDELVVANAISGSGGITQAGIGSTVLSGANTYAGTTTISSGGLAVGNDGTTGTLGTGAVIDNGDLEFLRTDTITVANNISGTGDVAQFFGTTILTGVNTYSGETDVISGDLKIGAASALSGNTSAVFVGGGATFDLDGFSQSVSSLVGVGTVDNSGAAAVTLTINDADDDTFSGIIQNTGGALTLDVNGSATLTLTGANTYSGGTNIDDGILLVTGAGTLGTGAVVDKTTLTFAGGVGVGNAISGSGVVNFTGGNYALTGANSYTGQTTINASATLDIGNGGTTGSLGSGAVVDNNLLTFDLSSGTLDVTGAISGTGEVDQGHFTGSTVTAGTTILSGANGSWTGATFVFGGVLKAGATDAISSASSFVSIAGGGELDLGGFSQSLNNVQGSGAIDNSGGAAATLTETNTGQLFLSGVISNSGGALSLVKNGSGAWVLANTNTYTGSTTVNAGFLKSAATNAFGVLSDVTVASGATLNIGGFDETIGTLTGAGTVQNIGLSAGTLTISRFNALSPDFSGIIEGPLSLVIGGNCSLGLTGANTYTGTTTIQSGGELRLGDVTTGGNLGTGNVIDNGTLRFFHNSSTSTVANNISGAGGIEQTGGTAILTGSNTFTGGVSILDGTVQGGVANAFGTGAVSIGASGTLDLGGFTQSIGKLSGAGVVDNSGAKAVTLAEFNASNTSFSGIIQDTGGALSLVKNGPGALSLSGADTYSGGTKIKGGGISISNASALGSGGVELASNGVTLETTYQGTLANNITVDAGVSATIGESFSAEQIALTGLISAAAGSTLHFGSAADQGDIELAVASNSSASAVSVDGGTLVLATLQAHFLIQFADDGLNVGSTAVGSPTATLDLSGQDTFADSLTGSSVGVIEDSGAAANLSINELSGASSYAGVIKGAIAFEVGAGKLTLTGANTYSGGTTINGAVQIGAGGTTGSVVGSIDDEGQLIFDRSNNISFGGTISGAGSLIQSGNGTLTLFGVSTYTGGTTIASTGKLQVGIGGATASIAGAIDDEGAVIFDRGGVFTLGGKISGAGSLSQISTGTLVLTAADTYSGGTTIASTGKLQIGAGGTTGSIVGAVSDQGSLIFNRSNNVSFGGVISGAGSLTQNGSATLTLTGADTYTGGTTIASTGKLQIGIGGAGASITGAVHDQGSLIFDLGAAYTFAGLISGAGSLVQSGAGALILSNAETYTGGTTIAATRKLQIGSGGAVASIVGAVDDEGTLIFDRSGAATFGGVISGAGSVVKEGTGTVTLTGANSYAGGTTISAGVLNIENATALGATAAGTTVAAGAALQLQGGVFFGAEPLTLNGAGVANTGALRNISGANTFGGAITLGSATRINSDAASVDVVILSGTISGAGKSLTLGGAGDFEVSGAIATGTGTLTKDGSGTAQLTGANSYTGITTVTNGLLQVGGSATQFPGGVVVNKPGKMLFFKSASIGSLAGTGTVILQSATSATLTVGGANTSTAFSGTIGFTAGVDGLTKVGTGTLSLGGADTYSGATTISAGVLALTGGGSLADSAVAVGANTKLDITGVTTGTTIGNLSGPGATSVVSLGGKTLTVAAATAGPHVEFLGKAGSASHLVFDVASPNFTLANSTFSAWTPGVDTITINGNSGANVLVGSSETDSIFGGAGDDFLTGGAGTHFLDGGAGADRLNGTGGISIADYADATAGAIINLLNPTLNTGDAHGDTYVNIHRVLGSAFADTITGDNSGDVLTGGAGADTIVGGTGNDAIFGGLGADTLTGGGGADQFAYNSAAEGGDTITDFSAAQGDSLAISHVGFGGGLPASGLLDAAQFVNGTAATAATGQFLWNSATSTLSWDVDGTGSAAAVTIAKLTGVTTLTAANIHLF